MSKTPPIPKDQRNANDHHKSTEAGHERLPVPDPADANLDEQGSSGNMRQNLTHEHATQKR